jgi:Zn-dependent peptidase ImmA (M78 family)
MDRFRCKNEINSGKQMIRRKLIQDLTARLLSQNGITQAPVDVEKIAASAGATISRKAVDDQLSGFLLRRPGKHAPVIGVNRQQASARQRFTIAHETAHLLLHANVPVHIDRALVNLRDERSSEGTSEEEIEANLFAAELLMPASFLQRDVAQFDAAFDVDDEFQVARLAKRYGVSKQAMTIRLSRLGWF